MKLTTKEIKALNFCLSHTQNVVSSQPAYDGQRDDMQKELDIAKDAVAKLRKESLNGKTDEGCDITNIKIYRGVGKSRDWEQLGIGKKAVDDLNEIGYTGKLGGKKTSINEYFNEHVNTTGLTFRSEVLTSNGAEFTDTLLITKVTYK
jgi:hypothetical protein